MAQPRKTKTLLQSMFFVTYNHLNAPTYYWLFDPHSEFFHRWDIVTIVLLTFTALVTPYEVSFCKTRYDALFYINRIVDVCFTIDILFNFFLPFKTAKGTYETSNFVVAKQYFTTWFLIDLVSIIPLETIVPHLGFSGQTGNLKLVRIIRLLKMAKLLRVLRAGRMLQRAEAALEVDYATMELVKFIVFVFLNAHWLACLWHMVPVMEDKEENWITSYSFLDESDGNFAKYLCSFYWAVATLSTLGYGDVVPTTHVERMFAIVATVMGASIYSYIIGTCCGLVAGMGEHQQAFYKKMDVLNHFMSDKGLSPQLQERLRDYFRFRHSSTHGNPDADSRLLLDMSPALRAEVTTFTHSVWINKVQMWKDCTEEFRMRIAIALNPQHFSAEEYLIESGSWNTTLFVVERGIVATAGRLCLAGAAFGTDMLEEPRQRTYCAFSLSNVVVLGLERDKMMEIIVDFPEVRIKMRKAAIISIAREHIIAYSKAVLYSVNK
ncbi:hypothetical protein CYMTET_56404 [Cymbomonas tetramitiformis]|uniref:Cyclic nucleotide-binding domain-containing protein n=1 Tax=Cymbomonas tetramitiformis TaxID=36881 RepID=A0AAE0BB00_9CHLO|nr:hypothetical protein CYMTET_56404 [Cymbomonas tetramitiformis]